MGLLVVILVDGVLLQVLDIDGGQATYQQLELLGIEDLDQIVWYEIVESLQEGIYLSLDA